MSANPPLEAKHWGTVLLMLPLSFVAFQLANGPYLIHQPAAFVWLSALGFFVAFIVAGFLCVRFIPAAITFVLAAVAWLFALVILAREL
jgi:hypothetical protein